MIDLILAIISSSLVSIMMRVGEKRVKNNISMLSINYFLCSIFAVHYAGVKNLVQTGEGISIALGLGFFNGFVYIASLVLFQNSVKNNGLVLSSIFMKLGIMVPLVISILFFGELPTWMQGTGFVVAIAAIVLINLKDGVPKENRNCVKGKKGLKSGLLLVLMGCGFADGMSKVYRELGTDEFEELFLVITFVIAFIFSFILVKYRKQKYTKDEIIYGTFLGIPNYFSARFLLKALGEIPAVVAYSTFSISTIAIITLTGVLFFKEKLNRRQFVAIILISVAVILLN